MELRLSVDVHFGNDRQADSARTAAHRRVARFLGLARDPRIVRPRGDVGVGGERQRESRVQSNRAAASVTGAAGARSSSSACSAGEDHSSADGAGCGRAPISTNRSKAVWSLGGVWGRPAGCCHRRHRSNSDPRECREAALVGARPPDHVLVAGPAWADVGEPQILAPIVVDRRAGRDGPRRSGPSSPTSIARAGAGHRSR